MKVKNYLLPVAAILITAVMLLAVSQLGASAAESGALSARNEIFEKLLPGGPYEEVALEGADESIRRVFKSKDGGCIVEVSTKGYADDITLWVGVAPDGSVKGVKIIDINESFGLGNRAPGDVDFLSQYLGTSGNAEVGENITALTGATVSSKAITRAINISASYVTGEDAVTSASEWS